jgi:hypothetical protein
MMKKAIIASAFLFVALITMCLTEGRLYAMHIYGAPCGHASGFAGFLQQTHFLPSGGCKVNNTGTCQGFGDCTLASPVSGKPHPGKCTDVKGGGCTCLATP